jgi:hypothetical protein
MKTKILACALVANLTTIHAQETQIRNVSPFTKIEISGAVAVYYTYSDTLSLTVKAKTSEIEYVETKVEKGSLIIGNKGRFSEPVYVYVKHNQLSQLQLSGATSFNSTNLISTDTIYLSASGSSNINAALKSQKIKSIQSGASVLSLSGTTDVFLAELSGASSLKAYSLISKNTDILATGASSSKIFVNGRLNANASGASNIKVKGDVKDISAEASPASSITRIEDKDKSGERDSTVYNWKGRKIIIIDKEKDAVAENDSTKKRKYSYDVDDFKHWAGFSMGVNGYMNSNGSIAVPNQYKYMDLNYARSFNFQFNIIERQFNIVKNYFKIVTGFGFDYHSYALSNKTNLNADSSFTWGTIDSTNTYTYKRNKLRNTYIQVPLLLEFNTSNNPDKTFHIAFGVIGQYLIASRTKQILEQGKVDISRVRKDNYNMSPFAAKAHVNIGYKGFTIFGEYSLTPLFASGKGPELYPFTVGVRLVPFS